MWLVDSVKCDLSALLVQSVEVRKSNVNVGDPDLVPARGCILKLTVLCVSLFFNAYNGSYSVHFVQVFTNWILEIIIFTNNCNGKEIST